MRVKQTNNFTTEVSVPQCNGHEYTQIITFLLLKSTAIDTSSIIVSTNRRDEI